MIQVNVQKNQYGVYNKSRVGEKKLQVTDLIYSQIVSHKPHFFNPFALIEKQQRHSSFLDWWHLLAYLTSMQTQTTYKSVVEFPFSTVSKLFKASIEAEGPTRCTFSMLLKKLSISWLLMFGAHHFHTNTKFPCLKEFKNNTTCWAGHPLQRLATNRHNQNSGLNFFWDLQVLVIVVYGDGSGWY